MKEKIFKHSLLLGVELILFIIVNIFIASFMFIFKVGISKYYVFISLLISFFIIVYLLVKSKFLNKKNFYLIFIYVFFPILIIWASVYLNGKVIDTSYDGNAYQKLTVGLLKNGWNPVYESSEDFDAHNDISLYVKESGHYLWVNHYAKASHVFEANIYALTNNIESGKCINTLSIISLFLISFSLLVLHYKKIIFPLIFTICIITPSFVCSQFLTNYIDLLVYIYMILLILSFFYFHYSDDKKIGFIIYLSSLLMLINIKFNSFAFAGIYCLGYYIYYIIKLKRGLFDKKFFWKFTWTSVVGVIIGVFVIGLSVYPKNFIQKGHPFYPIYGSGKVDIITMYQPASFKNMNTPKKYFVSMFSKVDNIGWWSKYEPSYKIPFTYDDHEIDVIKYSDTRISGNGVLFGGIFIVVCISLLITSFIIFKKDKNLFILCTIPLVITIILILFLSESWWARYFPQTYFIVLFALLYLYEIKNNTSLVTLTVLIMMLLYNNFITFRESVNYAFEFKNDVSKDLITIKNSLEKDDILVLKSPSFVASLYNMLDYFDGYNVKIFSDNENDVKYNTMFSGQMSWRIIKKNVEKSTKTSKVNSFKKAGVK